MMGALQSASSHQGISRSEEVGPFILSQVVHPPKSRIGWHSHELAAFTFTLEGSSTETFGTDSFERVKHGLLLRPAGERHRDSVGSEGETCFLIELKKAWLADLPTLASILRSPTFYPAGSLSQLAARVYREWDSADSACPIAIQALVYEMAARLIREGNAREDAQPPIWLKRVKQRLDHDFVETPSLEQLASIGGVHPTHLCRNFRRHYHSTIGEYLRRRRVEAASELLLHTNRSLVEIALDAGFSGHAHFCTIFRRSTGVTPSEFRRGR